ncbi:hypothetical protein [Paenibacillus sp. RUD330]|uniref:hypothetical protein n=1 Tax=Paenibacillus sp. RUD330 TaxID=2023772 RepID=UPI000B92C626|nr:hypothetical protein [Paenibacillus sp. RUD330]ASS66208.1 hypothetical protein CIC07_08650 [Paenibacillus sp. RUD330]
MISLEEKAQIKSLHLSAMERRLYALQLDHIGAEAAGDAKSCKELGTQIEALIKAIEAVEERG